MLCYIDLEHEKILEDPARREEHLLVRAKEKLRFEALSSVPCLVLHHSFAVEGWVERLRPWAVLLSGMHTDWSEYDPATLDALIDFIRQWQRPMLGFCAGHQLIANAFGAPIGPIRPLRLGEPDPQPDYGPGLVKESGIKEVALIQQDPLFDGLSNPIEVVQDHYWEVKELPDSFTWLAETEICPIQAFRHQQRPIYGTQFHPERYENNYPDGQRLLYNFFQLAASFQQSAGG